MIRSSPRKTRIVSLYRDLEKAFDAIEHDIPLYKREHYGVRGIAQKGFESYLRNRLQYVEVNGMRSNQKTIPCGVSQILEHLFLIYINDLTAVCQNVNVTLFADHASLLNIGRELELVRDDIDKVHEWLIANKSVLYVKNAQADFKISASKNIYSIDSINFKKF